MDNIKVDNNGYWDPRNWNRPVRIESNQITMRPDEYGRIVPGPVHGIGRDANGTIVEDKIMYPGYDYSFNKSVIVDEYPMWNQQRNLPKNFDGNLNEIYSEQITIKQDDNNIIIPPQNYEEVLNENIPQNKIQIEEQENIDPIIEKQEQNKDPQRRTYEDVVQMQTDLSNEGYYDFIKDYNKRDLMLVQQKLVDSGYDIGTTGKFGNGIDGVWGPKTQKAWREFNIDGKEGYNTSTALEYYKNDYGYSYKQENLQSKGFNGDSSTNVNNQIGNIIDEDGIQATVEKNPYILETKIKREQENDENENTVYNEVPIVKNISDLNSIVEEESKIESELKPKYQTEEIKEQSEQTDSTSKIKYSGNEAAKKIESQKTKSRYKNESDKKHFDYEDNNEKLNSIQNKSKEELKNDYKWNYKTYESIDPCEVPFPAVGTDYIEGMPMSTNEDDLRVDVIQYDFGSLTDVNFRKYNGKPVFKLERKNKNDNDEINYEEGCMGGLQIYLSQNGISFKTQEDLGINGGSIRGKTSTNAWTVFNDMAEKEKSTVIFNAFEDYDKKVYYTSNLTNPSKHDAHFAEHRDAVIEHVKNIMTTNEYKDAMQNLKPGDVVGLMYGASNQYLVASTDNKEKKYKTYNTHVGIVTQCSDGKLYVWHNVHGKQHLTPLSNAINPNGLNYKSGTDQVKIATVVRPGNEDNTIGTSQKYYDCSRFGITVSDDGVDFDSGKKSTISRFDKVFGSTAYRMYGKMNNNKEIYMQQYEIDDDDTYNYVSSLVIGVSFAETLLGYNPKVKDQRYGLNAEENENSNDKHVRSERFYKTGIGKLTNKYIRSQSNTLLNMKFNSDNFSKEELESLGIYDLVKDDVHFESNDIMEMPSFNNSEDSYGNLIDFGSRTRRRLKNVKYDKDENGNLIVNKEYEDKEYKQLSPYDVSEMDFETKTQIINSPEFSAQLGMYLVNKQVKIIDRCLDMIDAPEEMKSHNKHNEFYTAMFYMVWNQGIENAKTQKTMIKAVDLYKKGLASHNMSEYKKYVHDSMFHNHAAKNVRYITQVIDFDIKGNIDNQNVNVGLPTIVVKPKQKSTTNQFDYYHDMSGTLPFYSKDKYDENEETENENINVEEEYLNQLANIKRLENKSKSINSSLEKAVSYKVGSLSFILAESNKDKNN